MHSISFPALVRPNAPSGEQYDPGCTPVRILAVVVFVVVPGFLVVVLVFGAGALVVVLERVVVLEVADVAFAAVLLAVDGAVVGAVVVTGGLDVVDAALSTVVALVVVLDAVATGPVSPAGVPPESLPPSNALPIAPTRNNAAKTVRIL